MIKNTLKINKNKAFSLVEVLISLLLISLVMVAMAPVITKKTTEKTNEGIVYTYNPNNNTINNNVCYITNLSSYSSSTETYTSTRNCSEYQFKVPNGVHKINLTLVAGGGGGGGAAGGKTETKTFQTQGAAVSHTNTQGFKPDILKSITIKNLIAKGQNGKDVNSECNSGDTKCGGRGGNSSVSFLNFKIPEKYIRGFNFTNSLQTPSNLNGKLTIEATTNPYVKITTSETSSFIEANKTQYGIDYGDTSYSPYCNLGSESRITFTPSGSPVCGIMPPYIIDSVQGDYGRGESGEKTIYTDSQGAIFAGGAGAMAKGSSTFGSGGMGAFLKLVCPNTPTNKECLVKNTTDSTYTQATEGNGAFVSVDYTVEYAGGTGGGGAGGSAARIIGLDVVPNKTYTIVVGKGGKGGTGGSTSNSPTAGANGTGGTTSAIYDESGNLLYMVNGGAGGQGGSVYDGSSYAGKMGYSGRFAPKIISGDKNLISNIKLDNKLNTKSNSNIGSKPSNAGNSTSLDSINILYPYNDTEPFLTLNNKKDDNPASVDYRTGGFSGFDISSVTYSTVSYNGDNISSAYNGLYYRNLINNYGAYIGGLGGFSGVSQKAGCGGFFMGNFDGRTNGSSNSSLINKFIAGNKLFSVSKYYENCSINSPNGTSAEFVSPKPNSSNLGSAGSGGGGGGYNISLGSGNGGDGQNGYVMIEWRK